MHVRKEDPRATHERLLRVIRSARIDELAGTYAFEESDEPRIDEHTLACIRDGRRWSRLVPSNEGELLQVFAVHFPAGVDNSGFIGWLASLLKERTGTGVAVMCGSSPNDGGIFDYWACPVAAADDVRRCIFELLHIREWQPADDAAIRELVTASLAEYGFTWSAVSEADLEDVGASYFDRGGAFFVLTEGERVVGTVGLVALSDGACKLRKMYVARDRRGRGHGRALLRFALDEARRRGFSEVILETSGRMVEAIALYESAGFERIDRKPESPRCDAVYRWSVVGSR